MSPRWVLAHVKGIPLGSAFSAEQRGGAKFRGWDDQMYAVAAMVNAVRANTYITLMANRDPKKKAPKPPEPYPVPDEVSSKKPQGPGSFAFMAKQRLAQVKKLKESADAR